MVKSRRRGTVWIWGGAALSVALAAGVALALYQQLEGSSGSETSAPSASAGGQASEVTRRARAMAASEADELPPEVQRRYFEGRLRTARASVRTLAKALNEARAARRTPRADGGARQAGERSEALAEQLQRARARIKRMREGLEKAR